MFDRSWKRITGMLVCIALVLSLVPVGAFAAGDGLCEHHSAHTDCGYDEAAGTACGFVCEICNAEISSGEETVSAQESPGDIGVSDEGSIGTGTPDGMPPVLQGVSLSAASVAAPGEIEIRVDVTDDVSGPSYGWIHFLCEDTGKEISIHLDSEYYDEEIGQYVPYEDGKLGGTLIIDRYVEAGTFRIQSIELVDVANNRIYYDRWVEETEKHYAPLPESVKALSLTVTDPDTADGTPPVLHGVTLSDTAVSAPDKIEIRMDVTDDVSGPSYCWLHFLCEETGKEITAHLDSEYYDEEIGQYVPYEDGKLGGTLIIDQYVQTGTFRIQTAEIVDTAGNRMYYDRRADYSEKNYAPLPETVKAVALKVTQSDTPDGMPPVLQGVTLSSNHITAPGMLNVTVDATDDVSGPDYCWLDLGCEETGKRITVHLDSEYYDEEIGQNVPYGDGKLHATLRIDQYVETGTFQVISVEIVDRANNRYYYDRWAYETEKFFGPLPERVKAITLNIRNTGADLSTSVSKPTFVQEVKNAEDDAYIVADFSGDATLTEEVFEAISGTDKTLDLISEGVTWRFNGQDIVEDIKPVDLQVEILPVEQDTTPEGDEIKDNLEENPGVVMKFAENGVLPGKATIQVKVDYAMREYLGRSKGLCVYYYNNQTGEMELIASDVVVVDENYVEFTITHCSDYVLTRDPSIVQNRVYMSGIDGGEIVWVDGAEYVVEEESGKTHLDLPHGEAESLVTFTYHEGEAGDIHTRYPDGMQVWMLKMSDYGTYERIRVTALDDILQYSGSSIRITGKKGIRMLTSIEKAKKNALVRHGLAGYKLVEYGTVLSWASDLDENNPLVLGREYARSNYAYKRGEADPVFAQTPDSIQYTNVLVGFTLDQCSDDIAMRPYMILEDASGEQVTIYGGIVYRSIGYIAWQNRAVFEPGTAAYEYVWEIIHAVYGDRYDAEYEG